MTGSRRVAVIGSGRMGHAVARLAAERGWTVTAMIGAADNAAGHGVTRASLAGADVAVEFTVAAAAPANIRACVAAGCPVVSGTTGWQDAMAAVRAEVATAGGTLLWAANFSVGVQILSDLVEQAARVVARAKATAGGHAAFDVAIVETHHAGKKDAPSGTARLLAARAADGEGGGRTAESIPISSVRIGHVPGTHEVLFDAPFEQLRLTHEARDRRVFAEGALLAAGWLIGRRGVFTMHDVLHGEAPT
jgi:4-hydroxy-tetrahydrodipicolinate reductase